MFKQSLQILPIHHQILLCLTPFPVGCVQCKTLGVFPQAWLVNKEIGDYWSKALINFVLHLLHFSILWQFLWVAGLHLSILILCLSWLTEWKSLEPAIKAALHRLLQRIGFGRVCGAECRSNKVILNQESTYLLSQEPGAKWNCSSGKSAVTSLCNAMSCPGRTGPPVLLTLPFLLE